MSDLVGNPEDRFSRVAAHSSLTGAENKIFKVYYFNHIYCNEKTNNLVSDQVRHIPANTVRKVGLRLEILDLRRKSLRKLAHAIYETKENSIGKR